MALDSRGKLDRSSIIIPSVMGEEGACHWKRRENWGYNS